MNPGSRALVGSGLALAMWMAAAFAQVRSADGWYTDGVDAPRVSRPELDLLQAGWFRLSDGGLVFRVRTGGRLPASHLRFLLDFGRATGSEAVTRFPTWMIEGDVVYRRPEHARGWQWNEAMTTVSSDSALGIRNTLLPPSLNELPVRWAVETLSEDWSVVDRLPATGFIETASAQIQELAPESLAPESERPVIPTRRPHLERWSAVVGGTDWVAEASTAWPSLRVEVPDPTPIQLAFAIRLETGDVRELTAQRCERRGAVRRWQGQIEDLAWTVVVTGDTASALWVGGELRSERERCVEWIARVNLPKERWQAVRWNEREVSLGPDSWSGAEDAVAWGVGAQGWSALWPVAMVRNARGESVVVGEDPNLPGVVRWEGRAEPAAVEAAWPVAVTPQTTRMPGRAHWACWIEVSGGHPSFRDALARWHARVGVPRLMDVLPRTWVRSSAEVAMARSAVGDLVAVEIDRGDQRASPTPVVPYVRLMPWVWTSLWPRGWPKEPAAVLRLLRFHATLGGASSWYAQAAWIGACRRLDDSMVVEISDPRPGDPARLWVPVAADPDILTTSSAPWNRAMLELASAQFFRESGGVAVTWMDHLYATAGYDAGRAALAAADYSATWAGQPRRPVVARSLDAREFLSVFRTTTVTSPVAVALCDGLDHHSTLLPCSDLIVFSDTLDAPSWSARNLRYRYLAGPRPCYRRLSGDFDWIEAGDLQRVLAESAALGFVPMPWNDATGASYYTRSDRARRDAPLWRRWVPLSIRLAQAGWRPCRTVELKEPMVSVEEFGTGVVRHVTLYNRGEAVRDVMLQWTEPAGGGYCVAPLSADVEPWTVRDGIVIRRVRLAPGEVAILDIVRPGGEEEELAWLDRWGADTDDGRAAAANFRAVRREQAEGLALTVQRPHPLLRGAPNPIRVRLRNGGREPVVIADVRWRGETATPLLPAPRILGPGDTIELEFPVPDPGTATVTWPVLQWRFQSSGQEWASVRWFRFEWTPPLEVRVAGVAAPAPGVAEIELRLRNYTDQPRTLRIEWSGPFQGGQQETVVAPRDIRALSLPVTGPAGQRGRMQVSVLEQGRELYRTDVRIQLGETSANDHP